MRDPREDPILEARPDQVICSSTHQSPGCGHPVDWHTGNGTVNPGCDCCSWRQNDPGALRLNAPVRNPPPDGMSAEKWAIMNRAQRREYNRGARRGGK